MAEQTERAEASSRGARRGGDTRPSGEGSRKRKRDETQITAPSLGPGTVIEREPVEVRLPGTGRPR